MASYNGLFSSLQIPSKTNDHRKWGRLKGCTTALAISEASEQFTGFSLVITPDTRTANKLAAEIAFFASDPEKILHFPDCETLAYDNFSPHQDIISERINVLSRLPQLDSGLLIVPIATLMGRVAPREYVTQNSLIINTGETFYLEQWRNKLTEAGYRCVDTVYEHGEFAVRGSIIDLFPMGSKTPYRIELFDNEVESLRSFDTENQRSTGKVECISLLPAREFSLAPDATSHFKTRWRERFDVNHRNCPIYQDVSSGMATAGLEYYLPLFHQNTASLIDYLPDQTLLFVCGNLPEAAQLFWEDINQRYENLRYDVTRPLLEPTEIAQAPEKFFSSLKGLPKISLASQTLGEGAGNYNFSCREIKKLQVNAQSEQPFKALESYLDELARDQVPCLFVAESAGRRESLLEQLKKIAVYPNTCLSWNDYKNRAEKKSSAPYIIVAPIDEGLLLNEPPLAVITESQLYGQQVLQKRRRRKDHESADAVVKNLTELSIGAPVVHLDHGVGRYLGLQTLDIDEQSVEFLTLEYANSAKLYVPVSSLHLISRYSGVDADSAPLHRLGTETWQKEKRKAAEKASDVAVELLDIYARREAKQGFAFTLPELDYRQFSAAFPFEETPDQISAIESTLSDMLSPRPMDRLICGDVGFGKTEVAMRATFVTVQAHKQVAILVPTTLLAQQHYESFKDRFADWPVQVEVLSRFKTAKQQQATLEQLAAGKADIVIGTHKLLQKSIKFKDLGLIIVDEEHRFGVRHKETLKAMRTDVDILTLTATPIPRTLNMALSGMRDISIIATPPAKRLSIKTFVRESNSGIVKEAIRRELLRGGQVYYLHNEVKSIEKTAEELETLVPEARVVAAHGQMRERELEQVMSDFYHKRFNVLVCTTIIETGIDIPSANTIIMDRADKLGLAQLHQLRGRVGRSHHQAYAYMLTPSPKVMTSDAVKRLDAISSANTLGAGFTLASHDLEIRGAGELLGDIQTGNIHCIGFSLYMEMLEQAVEAIKEGKIPDLDKPLKHGAEVNLRLPALIPDSYLPDVHTRLTLYKRIANAKSETELDEIQVEMIDRFGLLTDPIKYLFRVTLIKLEAEKLGINKIDMSASGGTFEFASDTCVDPLQLVQLVQSQPGIYRLSGAERLKIHLTLDEYEERFNTTHKLLDILTPVAAESTSPAAEKTESKKQKARRKKREQQ